MIIAITIQFTFGIFHLWKMGDGLEEGLSPSRKLDNERVIPRDMN